MKNTAAQLCGGIFCNAAEGINEKRPEVLDLRAFKLELLSRFELETSSLPRMRSTN